MAFTDKELNKKIDSFLIRSCANGTLGISQKLDLQAILEEPDPSDGGAVRDSLKGLKKRLVSRLGITRRVADGGKAGSIDNLLVLINSFVLLFVVAAVVPVLYIHREYTWVIPFLLFCPLMHFLAFRLARNPEVSPSRTRNMHLFAAVVSVIPLSSLALFAMDVFGRSPALRESLMAAVIGLWIFYVVLVAALVRTEAGFYWALFLAAFVGNVALLRMRDFGGAICLPLALAMFLYFLAGRARAGKGGLSAARLHTMAGFFLSAGLVELAFFLTDRHAVQPHPSIGLVLYALAFAFLPATVKGEGARPGDAGVRRCWQALLAASWVFFGLALLAWGAFGLKGLAPVGGEPARAPLYALLILVFVWSLALLYEQFLATVEFDFNVFSFASLVLVVCLVIGYWILAFRVAHIVALLLAAGVFYATFNLHERYARVLAPEPEPAQDDVNEDDNGDKEDEEPAADFGDPDDWGWKDDADHLEK